MFHSNVKPPGKACSPGRLFSQKLRRNERRRFAAAFLAPTVILYSIVVIGPLITSFQYGLTEWNGITEQVFSGFSNYTEMASNVNYRLAFKNTITMVGYSLLVQIPVGVVLSYLLYRMKRGFKIFRALLFLPVVISPIAVGIMFRLFYNSEIGLLNGFLSAIGAEGFQREWLSNPDVLLNMVIVPQVWQYIGLYVVIFFAALQAIPEEVFESAYIDGASSFRSFRSIAIPLIREVIAIGVILCVTGSMKAFDHPWIMTEGGPGFRSSYLTVYMFRVAFLERRFGYGSAVAITVVLFSLLFTALYQRINNRSSVEY